MHKDNRCGLSCWHPSWAQKYANPRVFLIVYGLLGTTQAMSFLYFVVTLTTIEKRFKIPSQTTGIIISGNEISQIMLSLILSYYGGQRNRPRWISCGVIFCALSCFILALPHFIYGPGDDALQLTQEYRDKNLWNVTETISTNVTIKGANKLCLGINEKKDDECDELFSIVPLVLIFLSQFVLGIGNTLYYSLGQSYLDDNTKKKNTPMMLAYAFSLRMFGPVVGFFLGYIALNIYIDPTKTPLIDRQDPRWLGAWWFGWILLGFAMLIFAFLIGLFPKELPKNSIDRQSSETPKILRKNNIDNIENDLAEGKPLNGHERKSLLEQDVLGSLVEFPRLRDFPTALMRILKNKLVMYNIVANIFYILGASGYMTFISKYMEVQFNKNPAEATIVTGPLTIIGMVSGLLLSGYVITKYRPPAKKLFFWNVIVGVFFMAGQISYLFITCDNGNLAMLQNNKINLTTPCNANCYCDDVPYSPVCHIEKRVTYFSPCHAACNTWDDKEKLYSNCGCAKESSVDSFLDQITTKNVYDETIIVKNGSSTTMATTVSTSAINNNNVTNYINLNTKPEYLTLVNEALTTTINPQINNTNENITNNSTTATLIVKNTIISANVFLPSDNNFFTESTTNDWTLDDDIDMDDGEEENFTKPEKLYKRSINNLISEKIDDALAMIMTPGVCLEGCTIKFIQFTALSMFIHWLGATARISNILVTFRGVKKEDKSFAQGLTLMLISLFALIPGPIFYGWIIDKTCLIWNYKCERIGNCQLYDQTKFRYYMNIAAFCLTFIGVMFDILVWHYGKHVDLYGEREEENIRKNRPISPLIPKKS